MLKIKDARYICTPFSGRGRRDRGSHSRVSSRLPQTEKSPTNKGHVEENKVSSQDQSLRGQTLQTEEGAICRRQRETTASGLP